MISLRNLFDYLCPIIKMYTFQCISHIHSLIWLSNKKKHLSSNDASSQKCIIQCQWHNYYNCALLKCHYIYEAPMVVAEFCSPVIQCNLHIIG